MSKIKELLSILDEATAGTGGPDRALYLLLKQHESVLPEPDNYFRLFGFSCGMTS